MPGVHNSLGTVFSGSSIVRMIDWSKFINASKSLANLKLSNCTSLEYVVLPADCVIWEEQGSAKFSYRFDGTPNLHAIVLLRDTAYNFNDYNFNWGGWSALEHASDFAIYVPDDLVETYRTTWGTTDFFRTRQNFRPLSECPYELPTEDNGGRS